MALKVFRFQFDNNTVYQQFCSHLKKNKENVKTTSDIPFLPIELFKKYPIISSKAAVEVIFTSSGTSSYLSNSVSENLIRSKHLVTDISIYKESFTKCFSQFYGHIEDYCILALLPSYLEREGSSLIYMVNNFIENSNQPDGGFYLHNYDQLLQKIEKLHKQGQNTLLIGVTYALLELVEYAYAISFPLHLYSNNLIIMETGGMKGKRKELIREELHQIIKKGFGSTAVHSEYGMTELLSQAYSLRDGIFECPNWMQILIRDPEDALSYMSDGKTGGINIIDLANINSCAFIATQDLGKKYANQTFEVLGRFDYSDVRGCNLMVD